MGQYSLFFLCVFLFLFFLISEEIVIDVVLGQILLMIAMECAFIVTGIAVLMFRCFDLVFFILFLFLRASMISAV